MEMDFRNEETVKDWSLTAWGNMGNVTLSHSDGTTVTDHMPLAPAKGTTPTDPEDPEDPVDPVDPEDEVDPVDPEDEVDPVDPEDEVDPVDPEDEVDPVDPEDPVDPVDPVDQCEAHIDQSYEAISFGRPCNRNHDRTTCDTCNNGSCYQSWAAQDLAMWAGDSFQCLCLPEVLTQPAENYDYGLRA